MTSQTKNTLLARPRTGRTKFLLGGLLILGAVVYLIVTGTAATAQYFLTVEELRAKGTAAVGKNVRVSGALVGETMRYDAEALELTFVVANVPGMQKEIDAAGGLKAVLTRAVNDPNAARLAVHYVGPKPDLARPEAQAIMDGQLGEDGVFHADTLLFKCPTRYED
ncbi:MAG: cytochrome c maturation protein CcmE [Chloroflexi bacterium]|nr:cytochrome c maturation protein CcmE [Chloroflexota bacterium]